MVLFVFVFSYHFLYSYDLSRPFSFLVAQSLPPYEPETQTSITPPLSFHGCGPRVYVHPFVYCQHLPPRFWVNVEPVVHRR